MSNLHKSHLPPFSVVAPSSSPPPMSSAAPQMDPRQFSLPIPSGTHHTWPDHHHPPPPSNPRLSTTSPPVYYHSLPQAHPSHTHHHYSKPQNPGSPAEAPPSAHYSPYSPQPTRPTLPSPSNASAPGRTYFPYPRSSPRTRESRSPIEPHPSIPAAAPSVPVLGDSSGHSIQAALASSQTKEATRRVRNAEASARCRQKKRQKEREDTERFHDIGLQIERLWSKITLYEAPSSEEAIAMLLHNKLTADEIMPKLVAKVDQLLDENKKLRKQLQDSSS
ncbi:hypothetical protein H4R33_001768 [Dimargaris cristalligena]|uniref:BZIP domain-containing protein n=1 Tax=Dimargaris cristalligena TaxID=215637 RepID=A0A4P9ZZ31_9FUNG|nr:hypothetical protein H4R33_001768 [Dimargaris cristalligena]RKP38963.1 hypothetical protein BJ085DRAFT_38518 [Dimargaris cristalligena]|eukprot:RKP38963.1 hypothetical protein BJ085DRAFT_38518 [Dimargaris cristalligena]